MAKPTIAKFDPQKSLVRVGEGNGRGFVVQEREHFRRRFVITAAHCLPRIPGPPGYRADWEETIADVLGPLGGEATVSAECAYVDPISDVAVLTKPDDQALFDEARTYDALLEPLVPLRIGDVVSQETPACLFALDGCLIACTVTHNGGPLWIEATDEIAPGMSGSPILDRAGAAISIVSQSSGVRYATGISPRLVTHLPGWVLLALGASGLLTAARRELRAFHLRQRAEARRRFERLTAP
jgi:hypothetical protein